MAKTLSDKQKLRNFFNHHLSTIDVSAQPQCKHFGDCGGCEFQNIPYETQLDAKRQAFRFIVDTVTADLAAKADLAETAGEHEQSAALHNKSQALASALAEIAPAIEPSPKQLGYRQRMDYVFAFDRAGLRRANRHRQVVEVEECPLLGDDGYLVFQKALGLAREFGLESYDYLRHHGDLRYFVVRRSRNGETLLSLVTKTRDYRREVMDILNRMVMAGDITSGYWLLAEGLGDVSFGAVQEYVGAPTICETLNGISLRIGPNTFFQSNPAVAEKAYARIRDFVRFGDQVLDLYSGVGSIAITAAAKAANVVAVENVADNIVLATANMHANAIGNMQLIEQDSAVFLKNLADMVAAGSEEKNGEAGSACPDMLIINPPRPGVEGDGMANINRLAPGRIAYLSCNPFTLLRNLADVLPHYKLISLTIFDMFPQTRHFETLALLEKYGK